jgi:hypothetical protein
MAHLTAGMMALEARAIPMTASACDLLSDYEAARCFAFFRNTSLAANPGKIVRACPMPLIRRKTDDFKENLIDPKRHAEGWDRFRQTRLAGFPRAWWTFVGLLPFENNLAIKGSFSGPAIPCVV